MIDQTIDAHAKPPLELRFIYKRYQKLPLKELNADPTIFDARQQHFAGFEETSHARDVLQIPDEIYHIISKFLEKSSQPADNGLVHGKETPHAYEHPDIPGLFIFPNLIPPPAQIELLEKLLHRDLSNPEHMTNLHMFYEMLYPLDKNDSALSFFSPEVQNLIFQPKDATVHKPLTTTQVLNKKLRWMTLGGQYDWTNKVYPSTAPPPFPADVGGLIEGLFPSMKAQAAIFNLYSPGDTLSLHRDVSEECNRPLVSISLGCDGLFVVGTGNAEGEQGDEKVHAVTIRLRSGDAVVMSGPARTAWHSVPQILAKTCPSWMADWPHASPESSYTHWKGWMANKRINLNIRQMTDL